MKNSNRVVMLCMVVLIGMVGCSPASRLGRLYDRHPELRPQSDSVVTVITRDSIVYKDSIVYIQMEPDTVYTSGEIIYLPGDTIKIQIKPRELTLENKLAKARAWVTYPRLNLELIAKDTTLLVKLDSISKEAYYWESKYKEITTVVIDPIKDDKWKWVSIVLAGVLLFMLSLLIVTRSIR